MRNKFLLVCGIFAILISSVYSNSADAANRKTAVRYYQLAKQYASQKRWADAENYARTGISYDENVSDLWYIYAVSSASLARNKSQVIELADKALEKKNWVDYNEDNAKVLYADLLCSTLRFSDALKMLDGEKMLYSADAEYIRCRCYYNLGGKENLSKARAKIDSARRVYPNDIRFAELFFNFEEKLNDLSGNIDPEVQKVADAFLKAFPAYKTISPEVEVIASFFASGESRVRMLKSFNARGLKAPLYAYAGLLANLLTEDEALDYYVDFLEKDTDFDFLIKMIPMFTEEKNKEFLRNYLNSYSGTIYADTDGDLIPNLMAKFVRGRVQNLMYDENQDDVYEWTAECDFGAPVVINLTKNLLSVKYDNWPYVTQLETNYSPDAYMKINLIAETLTYSPFGMNINQVIKECLGLDFFFPVVHKPFSEIDEELVGQCALNYEIPTQERPDSVIRYTMLDGKPQLIRYYSSQVMYAQAQCEDGIPVVRIVDMDGDGLFETTEFYVKDESLKKSSKDNAKIMGNVFGIPDFNSEITLKRIQIDQNGDTIPDFTEEYFVNDGKIASWDYDNDGLWDTQYIKHGATGDGILREESLFHQPLNSQIVKVYFENSVPVKVSSGDIENSVIYAGENLYWIGNAGTDELAQEILSRKLVQGVCDIVQLKDTRVLVIRFGNMIFGDIIQEN